MKIYFCDKEILIRTHVFKRALERKLTVPEDILSTIKTGKIKRFGNNLIKFVKDAKKGTIVCIGEEVGNCIIIRTIERGN